MHVFQTVVRLGHTDSAGVMFFARIFELAHLAFEDLLDHIGHPLPTDLAAAPVAFPVVHAAADYRSALRLGDRIRVEVRVAELGERGFALEYRFLRYDGALAAATLMRHRAAADGIRKGARLPSDLQEALAAFRHADPPGSPPPNPHHS